MSVAAWHFFLFVLTAAGLVFLFDVFRRDSRWIGPHFLFDLTRLTRQRRTWDIRVLFSVLLLVGLGAVYFVRFPPATLSDLLAMDASSNISDASHLAQRFAFSAVFFQNIGIFLIAPPYLAPVIVQEREMRTLDLLYTTHLSSREIIVGKLFARLLHFSIALL